MPAKKKTPQSEDSVDSQESTTIDNSFGPSQYVRDEHGLLKNVNYCFNDDGSINWRNMIRNEFLYPNKDYFKRFDKEVPDSIEGLKDNQLLIKLGGIKELAKLRGFSDVQFITSKCDYDHAVVTCRIKFLPNYETNNKSVQFEEIANASSWNTDDFAGKFLESIAANRAFVRCVRNFLNIHIVGDDEIDKSDGGKVPKREDEKPNSGFEPSAILQKKALNKGYNDYEEFKGWLRKLYKENIYRNDDIPNWNDFNDIPVKDAKVLLELLEK